MLAQLYLVCYEEQKLLYNIAWYIEGCQALQDGFQMRIGFQSSSIWYKDWLRCGPLCNLVDFVNISDTDMHIKDI